jgi:hypothetical protein
MGARGAGGAGGATGGRGGAGGDGNPPMRGQAGGTAGEGPRVPMINLVDASELPDYRPPFLQQSTLGDADGNLWIRTTTPVGDGGGPIYYVVNRANVVVDRVQVPQGRIIVGFARDGVVYLAFRDLEGGTRVERARWRAPEHAN